MTLEFRSALAEDAAECVAIRGKTRQNAFTEEQLRSIGITAQSWSDNIRSGALPGHIATSGGSIVGYCFGLRDSGEIQVLVVLPEFENQGVGRELLQRTTATLSRLGHDRLFLGCSPYPSSRSYGFYRHLGWRSTGTFDEHGDEILEIFIDQ
ncbi:MAG: GNAT family N-acetyltransferase [Woeseiaceae bacterium]|nr:GNAT family N-acetyltransferase [Woeseiaceae bacterium]